jgi:CheY-like chemotaxis protein
MVRMENQTRPHVLVVDDHPAIAERIGRMVERAGFRTAYAFGGREGLAAFNAALSAGAAFSAVVTDFSMADLDGLAVAEAVKAASPATAVVLLTAYRIDGTDELPRHVDAVLEKPPTEALLRSTLARVIVTPDATIGR